MKKKANKYLLISYVVALTVLAVWLTRHFSTQERSREPAAATPAQSISIASESTRNSIKEQLVGSMKLTENAPNWGVRVQTLFEVGGQVYSLCDSSTTIVLTFAGDGVWNSGQGAPELVTETICEEDDTYVNQQSAKKIVYAKPLWLFTQELYSEIHSGSTKVDVVEYTASNVRNRVKGVVAGWYPEFWVLTQVKFTSNSDVFEINQDDLNSKGDRLPIQIEVKFNPE
ncbi:MAG: hypothetical protein COT74_04800 [Bdellovibrionales bacterium CG10_big_fil_rev_8_21_14_0_10_45_34]|nr:MAG: hypothetical protein COT74_04800 [Bdellovibrionales bacterium CG10_big_fil_rev_8_21_14_0_10_45_34]